MSGAYKEKIPMPPLGPSTGFSMIAQRSLAGEKLRLEKTH